jgi:hypothetical protein
VIGDNSTVQSTGTNGGSGTAVAAFAGTADATGTDGGNAYALSIGGNASSTAGAGQNELAVALGPLLWNYSW